MFINVSVMLLLANHTKKTLIYTETYLKTYKHKSNINILYIIDKTAFLRMNGTMKYTFMKFA